MDPLASPDIYYGTKTDPKSAKSNSKLVRNRTFSATIPKSNFLNFTADDSLAVSDADFHINDHPMKRRSSEDDISSSKRFLIGDIDATLETLLRNEDTDKNHQITIEDTGPKVLKLGTVNSNGYNQKDVRGTYYLSNLLQELTIAKRMGRNQMILDEARLSENPVKRLKRLISTQFWNTLTRRLDGHNVAEMAFDTKIKSDVIRLYVPPECTDQQEFFEKVARENPKLNFKVEVLPENITPEYVQSINDKPGLLALAMEKVPKSTNSNGDEEEECLKAFPYVVPGGRFNELYGWDSYMISLGLLIDHRIDLARGMVEHFIFQINYYGKILNANRTYYLCRSQPPFLTDMALKVYDKMVENNDNLVAAKDFLKRSMTAAIKEYKTVWTSLPRLDPETGLSKYHPDGLGIPPETEASHFTALLKPYAEKHKVSVEEFQVLYNTRKVHEPELDEYFLNDRAVRESGHDTSYRLDGKAAHLCTVDLNSLLYKYEIDIGKTIRDKFNDSFETRSGIEASAPWFERAKKRKQASSKYLWNEEESMFFDYDVKLKQQSDYVSATALWPLWAGMATEHQAELLVNNSVHKLEELGGLVAGTKASRGEINIDRPNRQWDYPFGWAPQQILAWIGLQNYGFNDVAKRLVYRWMYIMTKSFVDYNGIVVEKYDVTKTTDPHRVEAEYGNQGADFKGVATEGFGWVNASYEVGLDILDMKAKRALGAVTPPDVFFASLKKGHTFSIV